MIKYANGLGLTVRIKPYKKGSLVGGEYDGENKSITVYRARKHSSTDVILVLLHELGHHLDFLKKGKRDSKQLIDALGKEHERRVGEDPIPILDRLSIYQSELDGIQYMPDIAHQLDLSVPMWKIIAERDLDRWLAEYYYCHGEDPSMKEIVAYRKNIRKRLKE